MSLHKPFQPLASEVEQPIRAEQRSHQSNALLTRADICALVGVSRETWRRWVLAGVAPSRVAGLPGLPKWNRRDIDAFIAGRRPNTRAFFTSARIPKQAVHAASVARLEGRG